MKALVVSALLVGLVQVANGGESKHIWKVVPGHKNIMVDMASIEPMRTTRTLPNTGSPDTPIRNIEETAVAIELNGHLFEHYAIWCSGGFTLSDVTVGEDSKVIGSVPSGAVEAMVCPKARHP